MADQHPNQILLSKCIIRKLNDEGGVIKEKLLSTDMIISFDFMDLLWFTNYDRYKF